jgi:hypothetical protein
MLTAGSIINRLERAIVRVQGIPAGPTYEEMPMHDFTMRRQIASVPPFGRSTRMLRATCRTRLPSLLPAPGVPKLYENV